MKFKFNIKSLILIFFLSFILVFAGCSSPVDCSSQDSTYIKYQLNSDTNTCEVYQKIKKNVCGNGIAEDSETYCNCPNDVNKLHPTKGCSGTTGDYLEKSCSDQTNKCELTQNNKVVEKTKSIEFKNSDLTIQGEFILNSPFILTLEKQNKIKADFNLYKKLENKVNIKNVLVKKLRILNSKSDVLATIEYNEGLGLVGDSLRKKEITLSEITSYKKDDTLKLELEVTYIKEYFNSKDEITKTDNKIETLKSSLGRWTLINPNFYKKK